MQAFLTLNIIYKELLPSNPLDSLGPPTQVLVPTVDIHPLWLLSAPEAGATPAHSISQSEGQSSS